MINQAQLKPIVAVIVVGIMLSALILTLDKPSGTSAHSEDSANTETATENQPDTGPRGGKLFKEGDFAAEVTIFEKGYPRSLGYICTKKIN